MRRTVLALSLALASVVFGGCAAVALTMLSVGAGVGAGAGVSHTLDGIAYKTFTASIDELEHATVKTLRRLDMPVTSNESVESGRQIMAKAGDRVVDVELDRMTPKTSRMRVTVKHNWLIRDRSTAVEIITQTDQTLADEPRQARKPR